MDLADAVGHGQSGCHPRTDQEARLESATPAIITAPEDQLWATRVSKLIDTESFTRMGESQPATVVIVSRMSVLDVALMDEAKQAVMAGRHVIPIFIESVDGKRIDFLQRLHRISAYKLPDADFEWAIVRALQMDPDAASALGTLAYQARHWTQHARATRHLLTGVALAHANQIWQSVRPDTVGQDPAIADLLAASNVHARRVRRWKQGFLAVAVVVSLLAGCLLGWEELRNHAADSEARSAASVQAAELRAADARKALATGDLQRATTLALAAVQEASTRVTRVVARQVLSVPAPALTFEFGDRAVSALAWSPSGRYLGVGDQSGNVWLLDVTVRRRVGAWRVASNPVSAIAFHETGGQSFLVATTGEGRQVTEAANLPTPDADVPPPTQPAAQASIRSDGLELVELSCWSQVNGSCMSWLPPLRGAVNRAVWAPRHDRIAAATSTGDVNVFEATAALERSTAIDNGTSNAMRTPAGSLAVFLNSKQGSAIFLPDGTGYVVPAASVPLNSPGLQCRDTTDTQSNGPDNSAHITGSDCWGRHNWTVETADVAAGLPMSARVHQPRRTDQPVVGDPLIAVGPTGMTAVVVDNDGGVYFLAREAAGWAMRMHQTGSLDGDARAQQPVFSADGASAVVTMTPDLDGTSSSRSLTRTIVCTFSSSGTAHTYQVGERGASYLAQAITLHGGTVAVARDGGPAIAEVLDTATGALTVLGERSGTIVAFSERGDQVLVSSAPAAFIWPGTLGGNVRPTAAQIYDVHTGELACEATYYQPSQPISGVAGNLASFLIGSYEHLLLQQTCRPSDNLAGDLDRRLATVIAVPSP